jgi:hypothetical protein
VAFKHGKAGYLALTDVGAVERNVSAFVTNVDMTLDVDNPITTTYTATGVRRQVVGLKDNSFTVTMLHDTTASTGSWTVVMGLINAPPATATVFKWGPEGSTGGLPRVTGSCRIKSAKMSEPVDGVVTITADFEGDGGATVDTF